MPSKMIVDCQRSSKNLQAARRTRRDFVAGLLALFLVGFFGGGCAAAYSSSFKLNAPVKVGRILVTTTYQAPDGQCGQTAARMYSDMGQIVAEAVAKEIQDKYGAKGLSAQYMKTAEGLPPLYEKQKLDAVGPWTWVSVFPDGQCPKMQVAKPNTPAMANPFPALTLPEEWKSSSDAVLFVFIHNIALYGELKGGLNKNSYDDFHAIALFGYALVRSSDGTLLGSGYRADNDMSAGKFFASMGSSVGSRMIGLSAPIYEGGGKIYEVLDPVVETQIVKIAEEVGKTLTEPQSKAP